MKKLLKRIESKCYWIDENGNRRDGVHAGISGNVSGIWGNVDKCELTVDERNKGVRIEDLIAPKDKGDLFR